MFLSGTAVGGLQLQVLPALSQVNSVWNAVVRVSSQRPVRPSCRLSSSQPCFLSTQHDASDSFQDVAEELGFDYLPEGCTPIDLNPVLRAGRNWAHSHVSANTFFENKHGFTQRQLLEASYSPRQSRHCFTVSVPNLSSLSSLLHIPRPLSVLSQRRGFKTKHSVGSIGIHQHRVGSGSQENKLLSSVSLGVFGRKKKPTQTQELLIDSFGKSSSSDDRRKLLDLYAEGYQSGFSQTPSRARLVRSVVSVSLILFVLYIVYSSGTSLRVGVWKGEKYEVDPEENTVTFDDVKGVEEAKHELMDVVQYLKYPDKFTDIGAKMPKGVLLCGPPGVGKTLLARAVAGEANVPFFQASGSEFDDMFVGTGARKVRQLFESAQSRAPCVIFIDEIDAVGSKRTASTIHPYANQTINQLLSEMDGFIQKEGVIVIGATNRKEDLDKALLRPGRFDAEVGISLPDMKGRREILDLYLKKVQLGPDIDIDKLARSTTGCTGADLANIVNQAALRCVLVDETEVTMAHMDYALDKVLMGPAMKGKTIDEDTNRSTAYHEAGHTLTAYLTKDAHPVQKVTLLPRGTSLGHTSMVPEKDVYMQTKAQLTAELDVCMGGRAAEELIFGTDRVTTGASSDFQRATLIATAMVTQWGMSEKVGVRTIERARNILDGPVDSLSQVTSSAVDSEISRLLQESIDRTKALLRSHQAELKALAQALLKYETLDTEEVKMVVEGKGANTATVNLMLEDRRLARSNKTSTGPKHALHPKRNSSDTPEQNPLLA